MCGGSFLLYCPRGLVVSYHHVFLSLILSKNGDKNIEFGR